LRFELGVAWLASLFAALLLAAGAFAQQAPAPSDVERVKQLRDLGEEAMINLRPDKALEYYDEAYRIIADPALLYNRSRAYQGMSRFPEALEMIERFEREASPELKARVPRLDALIEELRSKVARLTVRSNVRGARVLLNGKLVGTTPLTQVAVNAGPAEIEVNQEGYRPAKKKLDLPGNEITATELPLEKRDVRARLELRSKVAGARASVDGKPVGTIPTQLLLPPGKHQLKVEHESHEPWESKLDLGPNDNRRLEIELEPLPALYERWWFWTSVGVVVAGGVALAIALSTEREAESGDIPPGQVGVPLGGLLRTPF
jgi:tetratricopeptide (TPR) repeat protein